MVPLVLQELQVPLALLVLAVAAVVDMVDMALRLQRKRKLSLVLQAHLDHLANLVLPVIEETLADLAMTGDLVILAMTGDLVDLAQLAHQGLLVDLDLMAHLAILEVPVDLAQRVTLDDPVLMVPLASPELLEKTVSLVALDQLAHLDNPVLPDSRLPPLVHLDSQALPVKMVSLVDQAALDHKDRKGPQAKTAAQELQVNLVNLVPNLVLVAITALLVPQDCQAKMVFLALPPILQEPLVNLEPTVTPEVPAHLARMDSPVALDALAMMGVLVAQEHLANQANLVALAMMDVLVAQEHLEEMEALDPLGHKANQATPVPLVAPVALDHKDQLVLQVKTEAQDSPVNQADLAVPVIKDLKDPKDQLETQAALAQLDNPVHQDNQDPKAPLDPQDRLSLKTLKHQLQATQLLLGRHLPLAIPNQHGRRQHLNSGNQLPQLHLKAHHFHHTAKSVDRFGEKPTILNVHSIVLLSLERLQSCMITLPLFFLTVANSRSSSIKADLM